MMNTFIKISIIGLLSLCFSCEDIPQISSDESYQKIYIPQAISEKTVEFYEGISEEAVIIPFSAAIGGFSLPSQNIPISFVVNLEEVIAYNNKNHTNHSLLPEANYVFLNEELVIESGETASLLNNLTISPANLTADKSYLLPVTVVVTNSSSQVNVDLKTLYITINVQEKQLIYTEMDRTGWELVSFSSQEGGSKASNVLDGNVGTFWLTGYTIIRESFPHWVVVDMKEEKDLFGLYYLNRDLGGFNGYVPSFVTIYTSNDNITWKEKATFRDIKIPDGPKRTTPVPLIFDTKEKARYFKYEVNDNLGGDIMINITELGGLTAH